MTRKMPPTTLPHVSICFAAVGHFDAASMPIDAGITMRTSEMTIFENGMATSSPVAPRNVVM